MRRVFVRSGYLALAICASLLVYLAIAWSPTVSLITTILSSGDIAFVDALRFSGQLLIAGILDMPLAEHVYALLVSVLIGINTALIVFYVRLYRAAPSLATTGSGILGFFAALFGFGCAACGSIFILSLFGALGGTLGTLLPFAGKEFAYAGVVLLMGSAFFLSRTIEKPPACPV